MFTSREQPQRTLLDILHTAQGDLRRDTDGPPHLRGLPPPARPQRPSRPSAQPSRRRSRLDAWLGVPSSPPSAFLSRFTAPTRCTARRTARRTAAWKRNPRQPPHPAGLVIAEMIWRTSNPDQRPDAAGAGLLPPVQVHAGFVTKPGRQWTWSQSDSCHEPSSCINEWL